MISEQDDFATTETSLEQAIAEYLESAASDPFRARTTVLDRYPNLAKELNEFFESSDAVRKATFPFRQLRPGFSGNRVGSYELIDKIARGGMGTIWKARDVRLDRIVAVKLVNSTFIFEDRVRFQNEAEVISDSTTRILSPFMNMENHRSISISR